ncbi:MAG: MBL fold metallo-hydrolase [Treponema sp.]|jgi:L-ascorbate metabolism protein UlaG (beta-lactamase superfamily)|nr:MBL fold metallo-hydrolase [Treponema sp.]
MTKLLYQGHGSFRITTNNNSVIYVDPYAGKGYDKPADIILVTHQHHDHNKVELVTQKPVCRLITNKEALEDGKHKMFDIAGIIIEAVEAGNSKHDPKECVGYVITLDRIKIYAAGDTSKTSQMAELAEKQIDYALFPTDGIFNMGLAEAAECATLVGAKHNIPIHMNPLKLFDKSKAAKWNAPNKLIVKAGEEITL